MSFNPAKSRLAVSLALSCSLLLTSTYSVALPDLLPQKGAGQTLSAVAHIALRDRLASQPQMLAAASAENLVVTTLFSENFEGTVAGWTTTGSWEIGAVINGPMSGYNSANAAATSLSGEYENNADDSLTLPLMTLPSLLPQEIITLNFAEYYSIEGGYDYGYVEISADMGASWDVLSTRDGESSVWLENSLNITGYAGQDVLIRFHLTSDSSVILPGWYVDDVTVQIEEVPAITADISLINAQNFPFVYTNVDVKSVEGICPEPIPAENFIVLEDGVVQEDVDVIAPSEGDGTRLADIVFIMDNSGSLGEEQQAVEDNIVDFIGQLQDEGIDAAFGLTRYGAQQNDGSPVLEEAGSVTTDSEYFVNNVLPRNVLDGSYEPGYLAIRDSANGFSFRPGTQPVFIIITDETPNQGLATVSDAQAALETIGATLFAVTMQSLYGDFEPLVDDPSEQLNNINGSFDIILNAIVDDLSSTYRVNYLTSNDTMDQTLREVEIQVSCDVESASAYGSYTPGSQPQISLTPESIEMNNTPQQDGVAIPVSVFVEDTVEPLVQSVTLYYRNIADSGYSSVAMTVTEAGTYSAEIPAEIVLEPAVEYYVTASDGEVTSSLPGSDPTTEPFSVAVLPNEAPVIDHEPVTSSVHGQNVLISATVTDSTVSVESVTLHYREYGALIYTEVPMLNVDGDHYEALIPGSAVSLDGVQYYLSAVDNYGTTSYSAYADEPYFLSGENGLFVTSSIWTFYGEGSVTPAESEVAEGDVVTMVITPAEGSKLVGAFGCGGSLEGNVFTTSPVSADCEVTVILRRLLF